MANTIIGHLCGGAGITGGNEIFTTLSQLGEGFAHTKVHYLDTSRANIDKIEPQGDFWMIKTKTNSKMEITGSGAERKTHAVDIMANVNEYLDHTQYLKRNPEEFHCVIFSASGGTGGVCAPILIKGLLQKNIPVFAVIVGDSSDSLSTKNTINTLASLDGVARACNKPLTYLYVNNKVVMDTNNLNKQQAEAQVNKILTNMLTTISLFLSGDNEALDNQDMYGIIDQSHYSTITVAPGLYGLSLHSKTIELPAESIPTVARSLSLPGTEFDIDMPLLHHKKGYVTNENAIKVSKETNFPMHMLACANYLRAEEVMLKKKDKEFEDIMNNISNINMTGLEKSKVDEATGLVF